MDDRIYESARMAIRRGDLDELRAVVSQDASFFRSSQLEPEDAGESRPTLLDVALAENQTDCANYLLSLVDHDQLELGLMWAACGKTPRALAALLEEETRRSGEPPELFERLRSSVMHACPWITDFLVELGGREILVDLWLAAGAGDVAAVAGFFTEDGSLVPGTGQFRQSYCEYGDWPPYEQDDTEESIIGDAFCHACACGRIEVVDYLLDVQRVSIDVSPTLGIPGLHFAAMQGQFPVIKHLVARGARIDIGSATQFTCWAQALTWGHRDIANWLIDLGIELNLHEAVMAGRADHVARLLNEDPKRVRERRDTWFWYEKLEHTTALHTAVYYSRTELAVELLARGADPAAVDGEGRSVESLAQERGEERIREIVRNRSADEKRAD